MLDNLSYLAGLIDGEGSVGFYSGGKGKKKKFTIEIKMTYKPIINWLHQEFGGWLQQRKPEKEGYQVQWRWRIQNQKALDLYQRVKPLLKLKIVEVD